MTDAPTFGLQNQRARLYQERVKAQTFKWAQGSPYHNRVDDECCPDFSCCHPDLFEKDESKRWEFYRQQHGFSS